MSLLPAKINPLQLISGSTLCWKSVSPAVILVLMFASEEDVPSTP